jgi:hypothetical protein
LFNLAPNFTLFSRLVYQVEFRYNLSMSTVQSIEHAIHELPMAEQWDLLRRFDAELWSAWDDQIATDLAGGRLDALVSEARADIAAGNTRSLNEVLNHG